MNSSPEQSMSQRQKALARANEIRLRRATVRRELRETGDRRQSLALLADLIERDDIEEIRPCTLFDLLKSCYRLGPSTARTILRTLNVSDGCKLKHLSSERRSVVVFYLRSFTTSPLRDE